MNWITEQWVPINIVCRGCVKDFDANNNRYLKSKLRFRALNTASEFLETNKINLQMTEVVVNTPVFVCFEFDNFKPWLINKSENNIFESMFMFPPGTWKCFFTTQLG